MPSPPRSTRSPPSIGIEILSSCALTVSPLDIQWCSLELNVHGDAQEVNDAEEVRTQATSGKPQRDARANRFGHRRAARFGWARADDDQRDRRARGRPASDGLQA